MCLAKNIEKTIARLSTYSCYLERLDCKGIVTVSSKEIGYGTGVKSHQVRKDFAHFGEFGTKGVGYKVKEMLPIIKKILGLTRPWPLVIAGSRQLGISLCNSHYFKDRGFVVAGIFDNDLTNIGRPIENIIVQPMETMPAVIRSKRVEIGVITVPPDMAQEVADIMVENNILAILSFAPVILEVPKNIKLCNVDLSASIELLTCKLTKKSQCY